MSVGALNVPVMATPQQLCSYRELEHRAPLPAQPAAPKAVSAVAVTAGLVQVAVATTAPWYPTRSELLVLGPDRHPTRLSLPTDLRGTTLLDLAFSPDGNRLAATVAAGSATIASLACWRVEDHTLAWHCGVGSYPFSNYDTDSAVVAWSADGRRIAACSRNSRILLVVDATTGQVAYNSADSTEPYECRPWSQGSLALDAAGTRLAFRRYRPYSEPAPEGPVDVLDVDSGKITGAHPTGVPSIAGLAFHPDGTALVVIGQDGDTSRSAIVDLTGQQEPSAHQITPPAGWERHAWEHRERPVWTGSGPRVVLTGDRAVAVIDLATGSTLTEITIPRRSAASALTPDGRTLVTATPDGVQAHRLDS